MSIRDTTTGSNYEKIIEMCLMRSCEKNSLTVNSQVNIGDKPGGGKHRIDWEIFKTSDENRRGLISCKFQRTSGTAEEKIAYEVIKLLHAMDADPRYRHSWIIMGGEGWSPGMREFLNKDLNRWIPDSKKNVTILTTDALINAEIDL